MPTYDFDVAVIGGGIAGMSTAARLQATGKSTVVLEQHDHVGGCTGYYREDEFVFDMGATTLVDFGPGGVGGQFLNHIGGGLGPHPVMEYIEETVDISGTEIEFIPMRPNFSLI